MTTATTTGTQERAAAFRVWLDDRIDGAAQPHAGQNVGRDGVRQALDHALAALEAGDVGEAQVWAAVGTFVSARFRL